MPERQTPVMRAPTTSERLRDWLEQLQLGDQPLARVAKAVPDLQNQIPQFPQSTYGARLYEGLDPATEQMVEGVLNGGLMGVVRPIGRKLPIPTFRGAGGQYAQQIGKPGDRIPRGTQSSMGAENKIRRFRSDLGEFIWSDGSEIGKGWWRVARQPASNVKMQIERLREGFEKGVEHPPSAWERMEVDPAVFGPKRRK